MIKWLLNDKYMYTWECARFEAHLYSRIPRVIVTFYPPLYLTHAKPSNVNNKPTEVQGEHFLINYAWNYKTYYI